MMNIATDFIGLGVMGMIALSGFVVLMYGIICVIFLIRRNKSKLKGHEVAQGVLTKSGVDAQVYGGFITLPFWNYFRRRKALKLQRIVTYGGKSLYAMNSAAEQAYCGYLIENRIASRWVIRLKGFGGPIVMIAGLVGLIVAFFGEELSAANKLMYGAGGIGLVVFAFFWAIWGQLILFKGIKENLEGVVEEADYKSICFFQKLKIWTAVALLILNTLELIFKAIEKFSDQKKS